MVEVLVKKADGSISTEEFEERYPSENKNPVVKESKKEIEEKKVIQVEANNVMSEETTVEAEVTVINDLSDNNDPNTTIKVDEPDRNIDNKEEYSSTFEEDLLF